MAKTRIELNDTTLSMVMKMSGGNPGAVTVLAAMLKEGERIDPDNFLGGLGSVLAMDTYGIYEEKIWMLYKDICGQNIADTIGVLRAMQMGIIPQSEVKAALDQPYAQLAAGRLEEILAQVRERLPAFAKY